jgi:hypothetical protein
LLCPHAPSSGTRHVVEPLLAGAHVVSVGGEPVAGLEEPWPGQAARVSSRGQQVAAGGIGLRNTLGAARRGVSLLGVAGLVGADSAEPAAALELSSDLGAFGLALEGTAEGERAAGVGSLRLGEVDGLNLSGHAEASTEGGAGAAQWLLPDNWQSPAPLLAEGGVSVGGGVAVPWTKSLRSELLGDYDVGAERLLAVRSTLGYWHPCGCISALAWAGQRVGRAGFDAWLGVDLLP